MIGRHTQCCRVARAALPNPSLKRSANGRPPDPHGAAWTEAPRGPRAQPLSQTALHTAADAER